MLQRGSLSSQVHGASHGGFSTVQSSQCLRRRIFSTMTAEMSSAWGPAKLEQANSLQRLSDAIARWPLLVAVFSCAVKAYAADLLMQKVVDRKDKLDQKRSLLFLSFGGLFQGGFQYFIWNVVFESLWPGRSRYASLCKLAATNLISDPLFFFPTFYIMREACMEGESRGPVGTTHVALIKYGANIQQDMTMSWAFWLPGHYVTYFWLPVHLRVPWVACASFMYVCALSYTRGSSHVGCKAI